VERRQLDNDSVNGRDRNGRSGLCLEVGSVPLRQQGRLEKTKGEAATVELVNWPILKQPLNWITVLLMVVIGGAAFHLVMRHWQNN
jgi:hypothetical protein